MHEERPGSTRSKPRYGTYGHDSRIWLQWIINLLSVHFIVTKDLKYQALVSLHDSKVNGTLLSVGKRVTPWRTTVQLEDGSVGSLQKRVDGGWEDVTNPNQGAIALVETIGYYTASAYWPASR